MYMNVKVTYKTGNSVVHTYKESDFLQIFDNEQEFIDAVKDQVAFELFSPQVEKFDYFPVEHENIES